MCIEPSVINLQLFGEVRLWCNDRVGHDGVGREVRLALSDCERQLSRWRDIAIEYRDEGWSSLLSRKQGSQDCSNVWVVLPLLDIDCSWNMHDEDRIVVVRCSSVDDGVAVGVQKKILPILSLNSECAHKYKSHICVGNGALDICDSSVVQYLLYQASILESSILDTAEWCNQVLGLRISRS